MSSIQAQQVLKQKIQDVIDEYTRGLLDDQVHVIDISYKSLLASNAIKDNISYSDNYNEFYYTISQYIPELPDYLAAIKHVNNNLGSCVILDKGHTLLISKNFDAARNLITRISNLIPDNEDFGISFRTRNYEEVQATRALYRAAGSSFLIFEDGKYKVKEVKKVGNSSRYAIVTVYGFGNINQVDYKEKAADSNYIKTTNLSQFKNKEVEIVKYDDNTKVVRIKSSILSVLDLGHGQGTQAVQATPLGLKLSNILKIDISAAGKQLVNQYIKELVDLHNVVSFKFHNTSNDKQASGYVVLSIQKYTRNNLLSRDESAILNKLKQNIDVLSIPGSNTILQDNVDIVTNKILQALTKKPQKGIKKHQPVAGIAKGRVNIPKPNTSSTKTTRKTVTVNDSPNFISVKESFNLTSLQNLINQNLQSVISANMGDGSSKNVLNLKTGRLAASASVQRMSESRAGMITAFYTYMRNPYQTFEPGYAQGKPISRDPKLLIAKSIREIAALKVGNRLRAVSL